MLHTSPRILTAWCWRQYGNPSRFPGVNLASALVSSWHIMTSSTWPSHSPKKLPRGPDGMDLFLDAKSSIKIAGSGRCQGCLLLATWRLCWQFLSRKSLMSLWLGLADSKLRHVVQEMDQTSEYYPKRPAVWLEKTSFPRGHTQKEKSVGFQLCQERQRKKEGEKEISLMNCWTYCWCRWVPLLWGDL